MIDKIRDSLLKKRDLGLVSRVDWSGVYFELRNLCLIGLVKTSGLYVCIFNLLPWIGILLIELDGSESLPMILIEF